MENGKWKMENGKGVGWVIALEFCHRCARAVLGRVRGMRAGRIGRDMSWWEECGETCWDSWICYLLINASNYMTGLPRKTIVADSPCVRVRCVC